MAARNGTLAADRREQLDAIGFDWTGGRPDFAEQWENRLAELLQFRERFRHCCVPSKWKENKPLARWTHAQREFRKKGTVSAGRIARLDAIGFAWAGPGPQPLAVSEHWNRMFAHLLAFQKEHGHTRIPGATRAAGM